MANKSLQHSSLTDNIFYRSMLAGNEPYIIFDYWVSTLGVSGYDVIGRGVGSNANQNLISYTDNNYSLGAGITLLDENGSPVFAKYVTGGSSLYNMSVVNPVSDGTHNYLAYSENLTPHLTTITKFDNSGTVVWQRSFGVSGYDFLIESLRIDSSGNLIIFAKDTSWYCFYMKINTSGTATEARQINSYQGAKVGGHVDSSGNIYLVSEMRIGGDATTALVVSKFNSSGSRLWNTYAKIGTGSTVNAYGYGVTTDSSGNVYAGGDMSGVGTLLVKFNSSGTMLDSKVLSSSQRITDIVSDGTSIYVQISNNSSKVSIFKFDTSLTQVWARDFYWSGEGIAWYGRSPSIDSNGDLAIIFDDIAFPDAPGDFRTNTIKYLSDGSQTGSFPHLGRTLVIDATPNSWTAQTATNGSDGSAVSAPTITQVSASRTNVTQTLTTEVTGIQ